VGAAVAKIVIGLTKPAMMYGVPYSLFVIEAMLVMIVFIGTHNLLAFLLMIPVHGIGYVLTVRDNRFADVLMVSLSRCQRTLNRGFWGGDSYGP